MSSSLNLPVIRRNWSDGGKNIWATQEIVHFKEPRFTAISAPGVPQEVMLKARPLPVALKGLDRNQGRISLCQGKKNVITGSLCLEVFILVMLISPLDSDFQLQCHRRRRMPSTVARLTPQYAFATHNICWANPKHHNQIPLPATHVVAFLLNLPILMTRN